MTTVGVFICLMSAATFALGIVDVVLTYANFCNDEDLDINCWKGTAGNEYILAFVSVGIWASIPVCLHRYRSAYAIGITAYFYTL